MIHFYIRCTSKQTSSWYVIPGTRMSPTIQAVRSNWKVLRDMFTPVEGSQGALEKWLVLRAAQGHQPRSQPPPRYQGGRLAAEESESRLVPQGWPCVLALRPRAMLTWTWS